MDAFEIVRSRAAARRQQAALAPDTPALEVAERLALAEGYDPIPLDPDDPLLQGAEAVLDRGVEAIFYRGSAEPAEAATLIAHELGHLFLHGGLSWCHAGDLMGELGIEEADEPGDGKGEEIDGAVHRLDSYGARERQELQANVFARELLLPRPMARHLFLAEDSGATEIAERLALPLELVRQQLCDALLLPDDEFSGDSVSSGVDFGTTESVTADPADPAEAGLSALTLDVSQRAAAEHLGCPLLLEAGPGTGKTRTLVARVLYLMARGVDPSSILVLTFSNKAAQEIVERVARFGGEATPRLFAGTFHAFGLEVLRKHHDRLGLSPELKVVDRADAIALLEDQLPTLGLKHHQNLYEPALELKEILAAVSRAKDELVDAAGYERLVRQGIDQAAGDTEGRADGFDGERALEVARVYEVYEALLSRKGWVDFGDLVMKPTLLLETDLAVRTALRLRYRHVLVDEYQDVNRAGARLLKALAGDGERLWVVGDSRQSIYRFRGASSANMRLFPQDFPNAERKALEVSYRSTPEIVDSFQSFARSMQASEGMLPLDLEAHRGTDGPGDRPILTEALDSEDEVAAVAGRVHQWCEMGIELRQQAVLCRSNAQVERFARGLGARGLPVLHLGSLFERSEVRDLLALLSLVVDPRGGALARLAAMPEYSVPAADVRTFLDGVGGRLDESSGQSAPEQAGQDGIRTGAQRQRALSVLRGLAGLPDEDLGPAGSEPERQRSLEACCTQLKARLSDEGLRGLARLAEDLREVSPKHSPWRILTTYLFDRSELLRRPSEGLLLEEQMRAVAIYQFLGFVRTAKAPGRGFPVSRFLDRIRRLVLLGEERDLRQMPAAALHLDAVRLMTLHGSKGLEFEAVHLPSLSSGGLPSSFRRPRCPPPPGLVTGMDPEQDGERALHDAEEECLFFVALSRARSHLALYRPTKAGTRRRSPSKFLGILEPPPISSDGEPRIPAGLPDSAESLELVGREVLRQRRGRDLADYERCPRRFFYSRLFELPGYRRDGAYQDTQRSFYQLLDGLRSVDGALDSSDFRDRKERIWKASGPSGHAFEAEYRRLFDDLADALWHAHQDLEPFGSSEQVGRVEPVFLRLGEGRVQLEPDLAGTTSAGVPLLRLVRPARQGSFKAESTLHALWQQAALECFGVGARVEVVHLADGGTTPVALTAKKLQTRLEKGRAMMRDVAAGRFPALADPVRCPRCPYFFVCPTVPGGPIELRRSTDEHASDGDEARSDRNPSSS